MLIKVPNRNIIINTDEVTHIYLGGFISNEARIYFEFKNGNKLASTFYTQKRPYKTALAIAEETIEELAKVTTGRED